MRILHSHAVKNAHPLNRGLVSWWLNLPQGREGGGLIFRDLMRRNDGVLTNMDSADWVGARGRPGGFGALDFDGANDHCLIPDFSYGPNFTISFWFRVEDLVGIAFQYMFSHGAFGTQNSINIFHVEESGSPFPLLRTVLLDGDDSTDFSALDIAVNYEDGLWHMYTLSVGSFGSAVYIDGIVKNTSALGGGSFNPGTGIYLGGREDVDTARFFLGQHDDMRISNIAFSPSGVSALYRESKAGYPNALNWYRQPYKAPGAVAGSALLQVTNAYMAGAA